MKSTFQAMSTVFTARSVGYLIGSVISGWLFDRWNGYFVLAISCLVASVSMAIVPLTGSFLTLMVVIVSQGLALGSLDTGKLIENLMVVLMLFFLSIQCDLSSHQTPFREYFF